MTHPTDNPLSERDIAGQKKPIPSDLAWDIATSYSRFLSKDAGDLARAIDKAIETSVNEAVNSYEKLKAENEALRSVVREHHKWQCEAEGLYLEYVQDGERKRLDITGEYVDSSLFEKTVAALNSQGEG